MLDSVTYCHVFNTEEFLLLLLEACSPHLSLVPATGAMWRHGHTLLKKSLAKRRFGIKACLLQPRLERAGLDVRASHLLHVSQLFKEVEKGFHSRTQDGVLLLERGKLLVWGSRRCLSH